MKGGAAIKVKTLSLALTGLVLAGCGRDDQPARKTGAVPESRPNNRELIASSDSYDTNALRLLLAGAEHLATTLGLVEHLPIREADLVSWHVSPPRIASGLGVLGTVETTNYFYAPCAGRGVSIVRTHLSSEYSQLADAYLWPIARMDTNRAAIVAKRWLQSLGLDLPKLSRECSMSVRVYSPHGKSADDFVPVYWVSWKDGDRPVVSVELFLPTECLRQLHIERPAYFLGQPPAMTGLEELLASEVKAAKTGGHPK
jgi:hypothetical protein